MPQYIINDSKDCFNVTDSYNNTWNYCTFAEDRSQLLAWLSPLEPRLRHQSVREHHVDSIGEWVTQTEEFRRWCRSGAEGDGGSGVLFCYGDPGVGKTHICSLVVDKLSDHGGQNTAVTCFYFDFAARSEQSATSMLGSLVKQIVIGMESIPEEISQAFQQQKKSIGGRAPKLSDIVHMLQVTTSSQRTFVCIDALDECAQRNKVLDSLNQILEKSPGTRVFVTGRPHIRAEMEKCLVRRVIGVSVGPRKDDIITFLRAKLAEDETREAMDERLEAEIMEKIPENVSEIFLLVSLIIDGILKESTVHRRRERLREMTGGSGLRDAYRVMIERIKAQDGDKPRLGMEALMWISHAERPLWADELCHVLAIELGSKSFNDDNITPISTLLSYCQGLITVDKEASTVRLIHSTLKEYLSAHSNLFSRPHSAMAEICLTYLNSQQVKALSADPFRVMPDTPFLEYCSLYWGVHAKMELSPCARSLALELFQGYDGHASTQLLLEEQQSLGFDDFGGCIPFSGLHCASFFGIVELVAALIEMQHYDINEGDVGGCTPLAWAAQNGHEGVVKMLLEREEVSPDKPDNRGRTPLLRAARNGHDEAVKMLLGREDVNPNKPGDHGNTPILYAAIYGHEVVVKILLEHEVVNPDQANEDGQTLLIHASQSGHEKVVEMLLGRKDVNPNKPGRRGNTPILYAAIHGHEGVVKILLEQEVVNADQPNQDGETPLWHASRAGNEKIVEMLLGREEVNPDKPNDQGNTPLAIAAQCGHEDVVKIFLGRKEVDPEKLDNDGDSPLSCAAYGGRDGVVKILLEHEGVNPDRPNDAGQTPLSIAAQYGHEGVVKILLEQQEVNPNEVDNDGQTPLMYATRNGHQRVIELLQLH